MQLPQNKVIRSLFISRPKEEVPFLQKFCAKNNITLHAQSQISFEAHTFRITKPFDVVFFSSIRAANFFLASYRDSNTYLTACIGETSAIKLRNLGLDVQFVGKKSGKPEEVAKDFAEWLGDRRLLFPRSDLSNRSVAKFIKPEQVEEIQVYRTLFSCKTVPLSDVYVFSSPSNVHAFLTCNPRPVGRIIAWGETTKKALEDCDLPVSHTLENSTEEELIKLLEEK